VPTIKTSSQYQLEDDVAVEVLRIQAWQKRGAGEIARLKADPKRAACLAALLNPPEYTLSFLG
jgi:hypothetical protein